jgi:hypothetical protein
MGRTSCTGVLKIILLSENYETELKGKTSMSYMALINSK